MVVKKVDETVVARYFYNYDNLIEYIWYPEGVHDDEHPHYVYDGLNRRVKVEYGTVTLDQDDDFSSFGDVDKTKEYVFDGTQPIIEYDNDGESRTVTKQYYWGMGFPGGIGALLYMMVPGSPDAYYYYHYDGSGNVTCVTDADKKPVALYEYDAFGNMITKCGSLVNDFLFSTQLSNTNAGLYMYMFRSYDPQLGRWTQRDPIESSWNVYSYCGNSPVDFVDPTGLVADNIDEIAKLVYGETSSLRPQWKDPKGPRSESNYSSASKKDLAEARQMIAGIAARDPDRVAPPKDPNWDNPHARDVYENCLCAARNKIDPQDLDHFVIWPSKDGKTPDEGIDAKWPYSEKDKITNVYGPFRNLLGGRDMYIFFYKGVK